MFDRRKMAFWGRIFALLLGMPFSFLNAQLLSPAIDEELARRLLSIPNGVTGQPSVILRSKHIDMVQFFGGGIQSRRGFVLKDGLIRDGLWLDLKNRGEQSWASASIKLRGTMDISDYNSLVIWVRPGLVRHRLWVGFQDPNWSQIGLAQARTEVFPQKGFVPGEAVQVVIPFRSFSNDNGFNFKQLSHITFEFGTQSVGNSLFGSLEILGVAFVKQKKELARILVDVPQEMAQAKVRSADVKASQKPVPSVPTVARTGRPTSPVKSSAKTFSPPELGVPSLATEISTAALAQVPLVGAQVNVSTPSEFSRLPSAGPVSPQKKLSLVKYLKAVGDSVHGKWVLFVFFLVLLNALAYFLYRRSRTLINQAAGRFLYEIKWPAVFDSVASHFMNERKFWKDLFSLGVRLAWLSPFQIRAEKSHEKDEYYAEHFLLRQIQLAKKAGIDLLPSLCFARTLFQYETFLMNPGLYLTKQVPYSDRHYSDEELRVKYIGYFPVWIPPFWQKKHNISERLLVAYGKLPGMMPTSDGVQFNLNSPELRRFAVRVIERFAKHARGVRIEGAQALLNSSMYKYWQIKMDPLQSAQNSSEFWEEVISAVKAKFPGFLFVADGAGAEIAKLRGLGFDFFENNQLRDILINQIRLEKIGNLEYVLSGPLSAHMGRSIHDVSPLLQPKEEAALKKQQNLLATLILSMLPGMLQHPGVSGGVDLYQFLAKISRIPVLKHGLFKMLRAHSASALAFARYDSRVVYVAVANFSLKTQLVTVRMDPFLNAFKEKSMYLFNDFLHGSSFLRDLLAESVREPALAILGQDIREGGLRLTVPGLSLRLLSVSLKQQISHESISPKIRQLHQS